jgi:alpha-ketoglutarate-dependent taurine dioxygenase
VCSTRGLGAHTDHFRADFIVWECQRQAEQGGETFVVDPMPAFESLSERDQVAVRSTEMHEHRVFADDPQARPIIHDVPGRTRFYFTYWLSRAVTREQEAAVRKFRDALDASPRLFSARLAPGELLVVDNRRLLHGREAFSGARHLVRTWVSEDDSWKPPRRVPERDPSAGPARPRLIARLSASRHG